MRQKCDKFVFGLIGFCGHIEHVRRKFLREAGKAAAHVVDI